MYWSNVLYRLFQLLNMLSLPMILFGISISLVGIGERYFEVEESIEHYISSKALLVAIINAILGLLIFLFIPATFI